MRLCVCDLTDGCYPSHTSRAVFVRLLGAGNDAVPVGGHLDGVYTHSSRW